MTSSPVTTSKWLWWTFLLVAPLLALLLLGVGSWALPVSLIVTAVPVYVTWRLLGTSWRTRDIVRNFYVLLAAASVVLMFADPSLPTAMHIPAWVTGVLGFYFVAAPLLLAGCVLFELHGVSLQV